MTPDPQRLQQLIDDFRIDEVLSLVTVEEIADAWSSYQTRPHIDGVEDDDPDWWAVELLMEMSDEVRLRASLDLIFDRADDEDIFGVFAAGPLEDFVKGCEEDESHLNWVEERAAASPRFREALLRIHAWSLPTEIFARLELAAGAPLRRPAHVVDGIAGELPGTLQITRDGIPVDEMEVGPENVDGMLTMLKGLLEGRRPPSAD